MCCILISLFMCVYPKQLHHQKCCNGRTQTRQVNTAFNGTTASTITHFKNTATTIITTSTTQYSSQTVTVNRTSTAARLYSAT